MPKLSIFEIGSIIRERLFRTAEKKHLRHMRQHNAEKERAAHADFLSKIHDVPQKNEHQHKIEHNGVDFWSYYFGGEEPPLDNVLPPHMQQHWDETQMHIYSHTISPEFSLLKPKEDGVGDAAETIERRWLQKFTLAKLAQEHNNLAEAEENFRLCLKDCIDFKEPSRKKALSAKGLAEVLQKRGNLNEADQYYTMAARIDEELLGEGDTTLESEFYSIAGHLIQDGNWQDVEVLYKDLAERLRMTCGRNDPRLARCLNQLAIGYCSER